MRCSPGTGGGDSSSVPRLRALAGLPPALSKTLGQLERGELTLRLRHDRLEDLERHLDRASNRLSFSMIIAAVVVALSIVFTSHTGPHIEGLPLLGLVGYGIAAVLGLWWAIAILRLGTALSFLSGSIQTMTSKPFLHGSEMKSALAKKIAATALLALAALSAAAAESAQVVRVSGIDVFYGVIPAEIISGHPADHAERKMHGGVPRGRGQHHLIVSLFDVKTGRRIENARVSARVGELGLTAQSKTLEPMQFAGTITYGNFFTMTSPGPYRIEVEVRPHGGVPAKAVFEYRHPRR